MDKIDYSSYLGFEAADADTSVLRDGQGRMRTRSLFYETFDYRVKGGSLEPLYTLAEDTKHGLPSFWKIYMECPTEFQAAIRLVGGIRHWDVLVNTKWFMNPTLRDTNGNYVLGLEKWREYRARRDNDLAKAVLIKLAGEGNVAAAKALLAADRAEVVTDAKKKKEADTVSPVMDSEDQAVLRDAQLLKLVP